MMRLTLLLSFCGIKIGCNLDAAPGSYLVRMVVRDSDGRGMAAHNGTVNIQ